ncbi:thiamine phosphate synthase [bacterium]|nr:thiamine phosphate synthase [bacterium]MBU1958143.1 thiamine phosphate synthase [bacterium]
MIYALIDKESLTLRGLSLEKISKKIQDQTIPIAQYRNKVGSLEEKREDLLLIRSFYHGTLIVNDAIELIEYADGLHVGQEDIRAYHNDLAIAVGVIREKISDKLLGLSTHNKEEILEANNLDLDYIGLGAYRGTSTKSDVKVLGDKAIVLGAFSIHPVGLIGGVKVSDTFPEHIRYRVIGSDLYED